MNTDQMRQTFVRFFESQGHLFVPSAPLVSHGDPTVLFTVAGMQPFKAYYANPSLAPARRLVTVQRCIRTNDIEEVGDDTHFTVFEMLGNFAFGDSAAGGYFKKEAISYAYQLVTQGLGIEADRLWPSVWAGEPGIPRDDEATAYWRELGIPDERITPLNRKADGSRENFWGPVGDTGPCGPCSEIYIDVLGKCPEGRAEGECRPDPLHECGRFVEIWNLVFNQFHMEADGSLTPLASTGIDTGAGFERFVAALSGVPSAYETDLFRPIIAAAENALDVTYGDDPEVTRALRVIADHTRAATFLVADGVTPSNEARGYVARRLIRRAVRYGRTLGKRGAFLGQVVNAAIDRYTPHYPHLGDRRQTILSVIGQEEARFGETLSAGLERLNTELARLERDGEKTLAGSAAFTLYDTFGFPFELTVEVAEGRGFTVDAEGFDQALAEQRRRARENTRFKDTTGVELPDTRVEFVGYDTLETDQARVLFIAQAGERVTAAVASEAEVALVLDRTPFYAERGGQVGDQGVIVGQHGRLVVTTTRPGPGESIVHFGTVVDGTLGEGDTVRAEVQSDDRRRTMRHHTTTHLLHAALRRVLGPEVHQSGSLVGPNRLRFDFAHGEPLSPTQRREIEQLVNDVVRQDLPVRTDVLTLDQAMSSGAVALFDEKYGDRVRVLTIGDFSKELCGGTHVGRTGEIGAFVVLGESSVGAGLRRIEALGGDAAERYLAQQVETLDTTARTLGAPREEVPARVTQLLAELNDARKRLEAAERKAAQQGLGSLLEGAAQAGGGFHVVAAQLDVAIAPTMERLREAADWVRDKLGGPAVVVLASVADGRPQLLAAVSPELAKQGLHAGKLLNEVAQEIGGRGGGRPELAQGGGGDPAKLNAGLDRARRAALGMG